MTPLPDRIVIVGILATVGLCFALVFWTVRLNPGGEPPMQWRDSAPSATIDRPMAGSTERGLL
ncbi:hypothetical protein VB716_04240 [Synechococcus sp. CCY9201]|uniref:hypothetical protein n=1 Tax=unclassified Synechococcus TaxID=2626047 RepID=UPI0018CF84CA|nr:MULTISPECIES: hypothetical protein [unclassified Synechococcus]MEA5421676.1 hypothetical protein [Synechococcus sp. CCY9202]MEA5473426.1 hypothetical protein [Synechococcus sp. CCY9201]QPN59253.1 hypothetical protein H8F24_14495 [Synechococcus sp. CBW1002]QPN66045.1 hypothetical protein H8F26_14585 [Synechococcus sp. CBW1006]CAK6696219.1 hypothetical protein IFHNHDMJ_01981 [Synechococcus sp. CBW1107]